MPHQPVPDDIAQAPIERRIDWVFDLARRHAQAFASPGACLARQRHLAQHPTAIMVLKCMDGRINIPVATQTPPGIIQPFRNLGGIFDLGWPHLGETLVAHVHKVVSAGRQGLMMITYHWSKGDPARGCAGFHFRTEDARAHTLQIREQVRALFGGGEVPTIFPLVCGFETDEDALVLHGEGGATLSMADLRAFPHPMTGVALPAGHRRRSQRCTRWRNWAAIRCGVTTPSTSVCRLLMI